MDKWRKVTKKKNDTKMKKKIRPTDYQTLRAVIALQNVLAMQDRSLVTERKAVLNLGVQ